MRGSEGSASAEERQVKIAIVGLGQMGKPIAVNLLKSGAPVIAFGRSEGAFRDLAATGVETTRDLTRVGEAEVIFLCLPDIGVVSDVLFGEIGFAHLLRPGRIVVDLSTCDYAGTKEISRRLAAAGISLVDAPISGMEARAIDGTLTIMCGGEGAVFDRGTAAARLHRPHHRLHGARR
jgi:3-hydroxyisobutyrate dehydrogenase-like beta-hydroxyacid dehydrogenase